jgi:hypothetical protein
MAQCPDLPLMNPYFMKKLLSLPLLAMIGFLALWVGKSEVLAAPAGEIVRPSRTDQGVRSRPPHCRHAYHARWHFRQAGGVRHRW